MRLGGGLGTRLGGGLGITGSCYSVCTVSLELCWGMSSPVECGMYLRSEATLVGSGSKGAGVVLGAMYRRHKILNAFCICRGYNAATFWSSIGIGSPVCAAAYDPRQTWSPGRMACVPSVLPPREGRVNGEDEEDGRRGEGKEEIGSVERMEKRRGQ